MFGAQRGERSPVLFFGRQVLLMKAIQDLDFGQKYRRRKAGQAEPEVIVFDRTQGRVFVESANLPHAVRSSKHAG